MKTQHQYINNLQQANLNLKSQVKKLDELKNRQESIHSLVVSKKQSESQVEPAYVKDEEVKVAEPVVTPT